MCPPILYVSPDPILCAMTRGGGYCGPGRSPDRADAMVWALTELMLGREAGEPRVRGLGKGDSYA
jgi:phage terminase large subunit-like protein